MGTWEQQGDLLVSGAELAIDLMTWAWAGTRSTERSTLNAMTDRPLSSAAHQQGMPLQTMRPYDRRTSSAMEEVSRKRNAGFSVAAPWRNMLHDRHRQGIEMSCGSYWASSACFTGDDGGDEYAVARLPRAGRWRSNDARLAFRRQLAHRLDDRGEYARGDHRDHREEDHHSSAAERQASWKARPIRQVRR